MLSNPALEEKKIDPRVKRTRALIQKAFSELIEEKGFRSITVKDITQRAEINRATFYAHFTDKFELLEINIQQVFREELEKRTLHACHYSDKNLRALIITVREFIQRANTHCKSHDSQFEALVERQVRKQVREILEVWLGQIETDRDTKLAAVAASWTIYGLALQYNHDKDLQKQSPQEFAYQVLPFVQDSLHLTAP
jgi:AcrR family transcriptional regulator